MQELISLPASHREDLLRRLLESFSTLPNMRLIHPSPPPSDKKPAIDASIHPHVKTESEQTRNPFEFFFGAAEKKKDAEVKETMDAFEPASNNGLVHLISQAGLPSPFSKSDLDNAGVHNVNPTNSTEDFSTIHQLTTEELTLMRVEQEYSQKQQDIRVKEDHLKDMKASIAQLIAGVEDFERQTQHKRNALSFARIAEQHLEAEIHSATCEANEKMIVVREIQDKITQLRLQEKKNSVMNDMVASSKNLFSRSTGSALINDRDTHYSPKLRNRHGGSSAASELNDRDDEYHGIEAFGRQRTEGELLADEMLRRADQYDGNEDLGHKRSSGPSATGELAGLSDRNLDSEDFGQERYRRDAHNGLRIVGEANIDNEPRVVIRKRSRDDDTPSSGGNHEDRYDRENHPICFDFNRGSLLSIVLTKSACGGIWRWIAHRVIATIVVFDACLDIIKWRIVLKEDFEGFVLVITRMQFANIHIREHIDA
ncbi:hypothetical protein BC829DRAFT_413348 [Chytridium lagenaria]|nr:hypothetical protein BC829DRAFT_413348 [Chytridium lagenaria]